MEGLPFGRISSTIADACRPRSAGLLSPHAVRSFQKHEKLNLGGDFMKMLRQLLIGVTPLLLLGVGCATENPIRDQSGATIGTIRVDQTNELRVVVTVDITNAPPGEHGLHLHTTGRCEGDFTSAGGHFNPSNTLHGDPDYPVHHAGDLGNISIGPDGRGRVTVTTAALSANANALNSALDRAVILHADRDDLTAGDGNPDYTGNSGARIGCGVVR
jgi:Cu-Zn family superoxide dismutase